MMDKCRLLETAKAETHFLAKCKKSEECQDPFFPYFASECNSKQVKYCYSHMDIWRQIWQILNQSIYMRVEWEWKPHRACRVFIPAVIHSDFDNYFSWAEESANRVCYKRGFNFSFACVSNPQPQLWNTPTFTGHRYQWKEPPCIFLKGLWSDLCCTVRCALIACLSVLLSNDISASLCVSLSARLSSLTEPC